MSITLISTLIQISVRVVFVSLLVPVMGLTGVAFASLAGWGCMLLVEVPYYYWYKKRSKLLQE
jgi:Na+-driven multidrug efflux pump